MYKNTPREHLVNQLVSFLSSGEWLGICMAVHMSDRSRHILSMALKREWLSAERFREAVHRGLCAQGRTSYWQHVHNPRETPPDHVFSPEALGYALKYEAISKEEARLIKFDHGDTLEDAIRWSENLFETVLGQLRTYKKPEDLAKHSIKRLVYESSSECFESH